MRYVRAIVAVAVGVLAGTTAVLSPDASPPRPEPGSPEPAASATRVLRSAATPSASPDRAADPARPRRARPRYPERPSVAVGVPHAGRLIRGVRLPASGPHHVTWDPVRKRSPSAAWRRHGTDRLVRLVLRVARAHRRAHPSAPRLLVGDLSRRRGGDFSARVSGGLGHVSHQNGLDVDIYYARRDRRQRPPRTVAHVDLRLAQDLVDRFVAEGARLVFTGPRLGLRGPPSVVQALPRHDNHLHVRIAP